MKHQSPSKSKIQITSILRSRKFIVITSSIVSILGICAYLFFRKNFVMMPEKMSTYFTVVLDCGSTGSRVNVYEWMIGHGSSNLNVDLPFLLHSYLNNSNTKNGCRYHCMLTEPGLHTFVDNVNGVRASLGPLISYAEQWVPLDKRGTTPVFVLATAGMRRLENKNVRRILEIVEDVKEHTFLYKKDWIRVLSGKEEAYYGWVALNYRMGIFMSSHSSRLSTLGLLDLGGSSLQVVAEVDGLTKDERVFRSKIGVIEHNIVAYSLPAFGLNEAFDRTVVMLSHNEGIRELDSGMFKVRHPCLDSSFMKNYTCHGCFGVDSRALKNLQSRVQEVFVVGEPNWECCKVIARAIAVNSSDLNRLDRQHRSDCIGLFSHGGNTSLNLTKTLHSISHYHALSGFFAVYNALNLSQWANLTMLWESGQNLCSQLIHNPKKFIGQDCFRVPYLASLLENALCLNHVEVLFGPGDISWTLGASLIKGEFLWHRRAEVLGSSIFATRNHMMMSSPVVTFFLLLFLMLVVYFCQIKLPAVGIKPTSYKPQEI